MEVEAVESCVVGMLPMRDAMNTKTMALIPKILFWRRTKLMQANKKLDSMMP